MKVEKIEFSASRIAEKITFRVRDLEARVAELEADLKVANRNAEAWRLRFNRAQASVGEASK